MTWPTDYLNKVICCDCLEVMKGIPDKSVDLVLTDPPYGFGRFVGDEKETYIDLLRRAFIEVGRILKDDGWAFVFTGTGDIHSVLDAIQLNFKRMLWMYKPNDCTFPWQGWLLTSEAILLFDNGGGRKLERPGKFHHDCIIHPSVGMEGVEGHPCVKPLSIIKQFVELTGPDDIILDPFFGSGTTGVAAKLLGRQFIGIEISEKYCEIARKRIDGTLVNRKLNFQEARP